jgi:putative peptidoglycan lipid II flippase
MGVIANLSRVMLVLGKLKIAVAVLAGAQVLIILAQIVLAKLVPAHLVVGALALGNTIGETIAAIPLVIVTRRIRGKAAVQGVSRATIAGVAAAVAGAAVGAGVTLALHVHHKLFELGTGTLAACFAVLAFGLVAYLLDRPDTRAALERLRSVRFRPQVPAADK